MVATKDMMPIVSPYTVSNTTDFTETAFGIYSAVAKSELDLDDPGLPSDMYDYCHALLISHLYTIHLGTTEMKAESVGGGDYSYQRFEGGETGYLLKYRDVIQKWNAVGVSAESAATRSDADMGMLGIDQADIVTYAPDLML